MQLEFNMNSLIIVGVVIAAVVIAYAVGYYKWNWRIQDWFKGQTIDNYGGAISTVIVYAGLIGFAFDLVAREQFLILLVISPVGFITTMVASSAVGLMYSKGRMPIGLQIRRYDEGTRKPKMNVHIYDLADRVEFLTPDVSKVTAEKMFKDESKAAFKERKDALAYFRDTDKYRYMRIPLFSGYYDAELDKMMYGIVVKIRKEYAGIESLFFKSTIKESYSMKGATIGVLPYLGTLRTATRDPLTDELLCVSMDTRETIEKKQLAWEKNDVLVLEHVQSKPMAETIRRATDYIAALEDRVDNLEGLEFVREGWQEQYSALGWEQPKFSKKTWTIVTIMAVAVICIAVAAYFLYFGGTP